MRTRRGNARDPRGRILRTSVGRGLAWTGRASFAMSAVAGALDLGRYRLIRLLGRGGMGEVYLAADLTLGRDVAIKFVASEKLGDPDARRRLLKEARAAAALDHPYICAVHEIGETADGRAYIVMQYVEGETLSTVLERGPMPVRDALSCAVHIAEALAAAHEHGVVHRDLKPSNVIITPSGRPKLLDFGIAKVMAVASDGDTRTAPTGTTAGVLVGTPAYMSPEQMQLRPIDGRSDLFSLGVLILECFTGQRAFQGVTPIATGANVLHVHPPPPSTLRPDLTAAHDELCRRLLAKDPSDRFQSASEVVGAIRLLMPDTSRTPAAEPGSASRAQADTLTARTWKKQTLWLAAAIVVLVAAAGGTLWPRGSGLPPVPDDANRWYQRGTTAIREGAYQKGSKALAQAIQLFPQHVLAHARLAEAYTELDDAQSAQAELLQVSSLVPDESRLPETERLRLHGVRAIVLRDVDAGVAAYRELVTKHPDEPGAWLDLGRAQEAAGSRIDARSSYERAIALDRQAAPAYLRLGVVEALESRRDEALSAFQEAERLYRAASDVEGETGVLLRRGAMYDTFSDFAPARANLERALALATSSKAVSQRVRIQLSLSSVTASEGGFGESERIASAAVQEALTNGLDTIAADGLVDLAVTLVQLDRLSEAEAQLQRAIHLGEQRGARRTTARARVQLAALRQQNGQSAEALAMLDGVLPFLKANRYRRYELLALSIASRAHQQLDALDRARKMSADVLSIAETVKDEGQVALAASNLASVATALGEYPEALKLRERAEAIHRRQGDKASLPYDLANRADLLIRLGRRDEADGPLTELESGVAAGTESFVGHARRAVFLRALAAATALRCADALRLIARLERDSGSSDSTAVLAPAVGEYCRARRNMPPAVGPSPTDIEPSLARERHYWLAAAALQRGEDTRAIAEAADGLALLGSMSNDELRWRLAAIGGLALRKAGNAPRLPEMTTTSQQAVERLRAQWKADFGPYERRMDLAELRKRIVQP